MMIRAGALGVRIVAPAAEDVCSAAVATPLRGTDLASVGPSLHLIRATKLHSAPRFRERQRRFEDAVGGSGAGCSQGPAGLLQTRTGPCCLLPVMPGSCRSGALPSAKNRPAPSTKGGSPASSTPGRFAEHANCRGNPCCGSQRHEMHGLAIGHRGSGGWFERSSSNNTL